ncbi:MAG: hypothetical protein ACLUD2_14130 [Clostridium sp.]
MICGVKALKMKEEVNYILARAGTIRERDFTVLLAGRAGDRVAECVLKRE